MSRDVIAAMAPALRMLICPQGKVTAWFHEGEPPPGIVKPLRVEVNSDLSVAFNDYKARSGLLPDIAAVQRLGYFEFTRSKSRGRLAGKIVLVTGGAQGFGLGIARAMSAEGAHVAVADINRDGAVRAAESLGSAVGIQADVTNEESVKNMVRETVLKFGGLDVLISNAGVLVAGGLDEMTKEKFDFVTSVNYTGYFLCAKYASEVMKLQSRYSPDYMTDIIEINSKSGLEGSNKNFAYAGSKFGGIGLTQSFAKELVGFGIKVNAVCPGNLLDGPLWSDPERGLFRQYLDQGKVPGASTIEDIRRHYEELVPMKRGCTVDDVARAILYLIEQKYETGQALPVTGGQVMLS